MKNKSMIFLRIIALSYLSVILSGCVNNSVKSEESVSTEEITMKNDTVREKSIETTKTLSKAFSEKGTWLILDKGNITENTEIEQFLFFDGDGNVVYYDNLFPEYTGEKSTLGKFVSNETLVYDMINKHNTFKEKILQENNGESYNKPQPEIINLGILEQEESSEYLSVPVNNVGKIKDSYINLNEIFQIEFIDSYSVAFSNGYLNGFEISSEIKHDDRDQATYSDEGEEYNSKVLVKFDTEKTTYTKDAPNDVSVLKTDDILDEDDTMNKPKGNENQEIDEETSESISTEESSSEASAGNYNNDNSYYDGNAKDDQPSNDQDENDYSGNYENDTQYDDQDENYYDGNYENDYQYEDHDEDYYDGNYDNDYQYDDYDEDTYYNENYEDDYLYRDDDYYDGNYENDDEHRW